MPTVITSGQITIIDSNDASPITALIAASGPTQQIVTREEGVDTHNPNWAATPLTLSAKVYIGKPGGSVEVATTDAVQNRKWSTSLGGASLGTGASLTINTNLAFNSAPVTYYFECDVIDSITGIVTRAVAQTQLSQVKTGTNAVYIRVDGATVISQSNSGQKNNITLKAQLIRASGVDDTGVTYAWYQSPHNNGAWIDGDLASVTTKYGLLDTAAANANVAGEIGVYKTTAAGTSAPISVANVPAITYGDYKGLVISELAVNDIGIYLVKCKDADGTIYQQYFTVYDISDPYECTVISTAGTTLKNGEGQTDLYPIIYDGARKVTDLTGWNFYWYMYNRNGNRGAFIHTTNTGAAGGRVISDNGVDAGVPWFSYPAPAMTGVTAGKIIKVTMPGTGEDLFFEVASVSGTKISIKTTPTVNTWLNYANPAPSSAKQGRLFACEATKTSAGGLNAMDAKITVTGDEIDAKANFLVDCERP